ncbi:MAG: YlxR family protein [Dehalococcoidia bacterium]
MPTTNHIPQRTCVACRTTSGKREFVRLVRTPEGTVEADPTGKRNGRGAYICAQRSCWDEALKKDRLARALRTTISAQDRAELERYGAQFEPSVAIMGN